MLVYTDKFLNELEESVAVESLEPVDQHVPPRRVNMETTYRKRESFCTRLHSLHVHVRPKQCDFAILVPVRLHTFEQCLCIVEYGAARF